MQINVFNKSYPAFHLNYVSRNLCIRHVPLNFSWATNKHKPSSLAGLETVLLQHSEIDIKL